MTVREKLKSKRGESLAEVLIALLISVLGIMLLAGMINASSNIILDSKKALEEHVEDTNALEKKTGTDRVTAGSSTVTITDKSTDTTITDPSDPVRIDIYTAPVYGKVTVRSYKVKTAATDPTDPDGGGVAP